MVVNVSAALGSIMPVLKIIGLAILFIAITGVGAYYFFVIARRRKWHCRIWEHKSDGKIHLVFNDTLIRYRYDKNKKCLFMFKISKGLAQPPPDEAVERYKNKEYCDYLRINNDEFIPMQKTLSSLKLPELLSNAIKKKEFNLKLIEKLTDIGNLTLPEINKQYVYVPLSKQCISTTYKPIDYDVDMMRMQGIEAREDFYKLKSSFWEKYGTMIIIGAMVVLVIVIAYLSFDYMTSIINQGFQQSEAIQASGKTVGDALTRLANSVGGAPAS